MGDPAAEKIARNNAVFREANDAIEAAAADHGLDPEKPGPFICECSDPHCTRIVRLTLAEYRRVRANPRWFVHAVEHETALPGIVRPVEQNDRFILVEKIGQAGEIATALAEERSGD